MIFHSLPSIIPLYFLSFKMLYAVLMLCFLLVCLNMPSFLLAAYQQTILSVSPAFSESVSINVHVFRVAQCFIALMYITGAIAHVYELKKYIAAQQETHP